MTVSIGDIAKLAGVSKMTVSRVINNSSHVRKETREKIERIMRELGYKRNIIAKSLSKGVGLNVVAVITGIGNLFSKFYFTEIIKNIEESLGESDYTIFIYNVMDTENLEVIEHKLKMIVDLYYSKAIRGVVLLAPIMKDMRVKYLSDNGVKGIVVGCSYADKNFSCVDVDDKSIVYEVVDYLVSMRHKKIGILTGPEYMESAKRREKYFMYRMNYHKLKIRKTYIGCGNYTFHGGKTAGLKMFSKKDFPTAVFSSNDDMAAGLYAALFELNIKIPEQVSIVGYDDIAEAEKLSPPLTTVAQPYERIGRIVRDMFVNEEFGKKKNIRPVFVKRESVKEGS